MNSRCSLSLKRRDFLALGSAGILSSTLMTPSLLAASRRAMGAAEMTLPRIALGHVDGESLRSAEALTRGDADLIHTGARVEVLGSTGAHLPEELASLSLEFSFLPHQARPFKAWCASNDAMKSASAPMGFVIPVGEATGITLSLVFTNRHSAAQATQPIQLSIGSEQGIPKLRCGTYVIAVGEDLPRWSACRMAPVEMETAVPMKRLCLQGSTDDPVDFFHVVFTVNHANAEGAA